MDIQPKAKTRAHNGPVTKNKRKRQLEAMSDEVPTKKQKNTDPVSNMTMTPQKLALEHHERFITKLHGKYDLFTVTVISSSKIEQRVTRLLDHLGQFHPSDMSVLPGVVLAHSRAQEAGKLVSIIEIVRLRVQQSGQKWFQYNHIYEGEAVDQNGTGEEQPSVIEDTIWGEKQPSAVGDILSGNIKSNETLWGNDQEGGKAESKNNDGNVSDGSDESAFAPMPRRFVEATTTPSKTTKTYMSIFLSRVPIPELLSTGSFTLQTNEAQINEQWRKKMGLD